MIVTDPTAPVPATPVTSTGIASFQAPWPQVPLPQPVTLAISYAMRIIAFDASAAGNCTVKSPELEDLSAPKSRAHTAGSPDALSLNISAPLAVKVLEEKVKSEKSVMAVVPSLLGSTRVKDAPFAV
jgi:hypothetical protein